MFESQKEFLKRFSKSELKEDFYFTGGTALSLYYFNHRESDDIDLFTEKKETLNLEKINYFLKSFNMKVKSFVKRYDRRIFELELEGSPLKVEFTYYPFERLFDFKREDGLLIDSVYDITTNKIAALCEREEEKDIFDLSFFIYREGREAFEKVLNDYFEKKFNIPGCRYLVERILSSYTGDFGSIKTFKSIKKDEVLESMKSVLREIVREDIDESY